MCHLLKYVEFDFLLTSYLIQPIRCTLSLIFIFILAFESFIPILARGINYTKKKICLTCFLLPLHTFSTVDSHLFIRVSHTLLYIICYSCLVFDFFFFVFTHSECVFLLLLFSCLYPGARRKKNTERRVVVLCCVIFYVSKEY